MLSKTWLVGRLGASVQQPPRCGCYSADETRGWNKHPLAVLRALLARTPFLLISRKTPSESMSLLRSSESFLSAYTSFKSWVSVSLSWKVNSEQSCSICSKTYGKRRRSCRACCQMARSATPRFEGHVQRQASSWLSFKLCYPPFSLERSAAIGRQ